jgi:cytochrome c oxidase cbb3-type subunit III
MSTSWSLFIIIGTLGTLVATLWFLFANRTAPTQTPETTGHNYDGIEEYDNPLPRWWVGMFVASILFAGVYLIYYPGLGNFRGVGGWTSEGQLARDQATKDARFAPLYASLAALSPAELAQDQKAQQIGRRLFINNCSLCHGINAQGAFGFPNLTDSEWQWGSDFDAIKTTIANGRTAAMATWQAALGGDAGVNDMAQYVLSLSNNATDAAAAARAAPNYQMFCIACHGADGKGNPLFGAPNLTNDIWLYGGSADAVAFTLRHGRAGVMPAFTGVLGADQVHIIAGYVATLGEQ